MRTRRIFRGAAWLAGLTLPFCPSLLNAATTTTTPALAVVRSTQIPTPPAAIWEDGTILVGSKRSDGTPDAARIGQAPVSLITELRARWQSAGGEQWQAEYELDCSARTPRGCISENPTHRLAIRFRGNTRRAHAPEGAGPAALHEFATFAREALSRHPSLRAVTESDASDFCSRADAMELALWERSDAEHGACLSRFIRPERVRPYVLRGGDPRACGVLASADERDLCYVDGARVMRDVAWCSLIQGTNRNRGYCVGARASEKRDLALCDRPRVRLEDEIACFQIYFKRTSEPAASACDNLARQDLAQSCLPQLALRRKDAQVCARLPKGIRDGCAHELAIQTNDARACTIMDDALGRKWCVEGVERAKKSGVTFRDSTDYSIY